LAPLAALTTPVSATGVGLALTGLVTVAEGVAPVPLLSLFFAWRCRGKTAPAETSRATGRMKRAKANAVENLMVVQLRYRLPEVEKRECEAIPTQSEHYFSKMSME